MTKIIMGTKPFDVPVKRFNFPATLETACPKCGLEAKRDFDDDYISYPTFNGKEEINFSCYDEILNDDDEWVNRGCNHEWSVTIRLRVMVEIVGETA